MGLKDYGFFTVVLGTMSFGLLLGFLLKQFVMNISYMQARITVNVVYLKRKLFSPRDNCTANMINNSTRCNAHQIAEANWLLREPGPRESAHGDSNVSAEIEPYYPRGKEEIFSAQRKSALEDTCMKFEHTVYLMVIIVLFFHLLSAKDQPKLTEWELFVQSTKSNLWLIIDFGRMCILKLAYLTSIHFY